MKPAKAAAKPHAPPAKTAHAAPKASAPAAKHEKKGAAKKAPPSVHKVMMKKAETPAAAHATPHKVEAKKKAPALEPKADAKIETKATPTHKGANPVKAAPKPAAPAKAAAHATPAKSEHKGEAEPDEAPRAIAAPPDEAMKSQESEDKSPKAARAKKSAEASAQRAAESTENEEIILTDADGRRYCRVKDCDQASVVDGYCRFHYLMFWKNIQIRKRILSEGKLERYVEELTARYPDKFLELLRKDLRSEKDFVAAIQELEIDDSGSDNEFEDEAQSYLDEVRGMSSEPTSEREEDF